MSEVMTAHAGHQQKRTPTGETVGEGRNGMLTEKSIPREVHEAQRLAIAEAITDGRIVDHWFDEDRDRFENGRSLAARLTQEADRQEAYTTERWMDNLDRLHRRNLRRWRIDFAMAEAWRECAEQNRRAMEQAQADQRAAYLRHDPLMEEFYADRIARLKVGRQSLLDVRRVAREAVDG